jgi:hypothetical protein
MPSEIKLDLCAHRSPRGEGLGMRGDAVLKPIDIQQQPGIQEFQP